MHIVLSVVTFVSCPVIYGLTTVECGFLFIQTKSQHSESFEKYVSSLQKFGNALESGVLDNIGMNPF